MEGLLEMEGVGEWSEAAPKPSPGTNLASDFFWNQ